jgi:hypothetical protein
VFFQQRHTNMLQLAIKQQTQTSGRTCTSSCSFLGLLSMLLAMSVKPPSLPAARSLLLSLFVSQPNQLLPLWLLLPSCLLPLGWLSE